MFFNFEDSDRIAINLDYQDRSLTYRDLNSRIAAMNTILPRSAGRSLVFLFCDNSLSFVVTYLAALRGAHVVCLLEAGLDAKLKRELIAAYDPDVLLGPVRALADLERPFDKLAREEGDDWAISVKASPGAHALHPELKLLLTTSGSTGSAKFVRLSERNLHSNASGIATYLGLTEKDHAVASLPLSYSYGLSVLNSHLQVRGAVTLTRHSIMRPEFWQCFDKWGCTSFAGVPYSYSILRRIGFGDKIDPAGLKTMTQAGGNLDVDSQRHFAQIMQRKGGAFWVMYGQTEAAARMSYLHPRHFEHKAGSVGQAIPGGVFEIDRDSRGNIREGEVVYRGPNVMMGYAESLAHLSLGDQLYGVLRTGDVGYLDDDGFLWLTGRSKRIAKLFGLRLNLDEVEREVRRRVPAAVVAANDKVHIFCESSDAAQMEQIHSDVANLYKIHRNAFQVHSCGELPLLASGKVDYQELAGNIP